MRVRVLLLLLVSSILHGCATQTIHPNTPNEPPLHTRLDDVQQHAFLIDYAQLLSEYGDHREAIRILEDLRRDHPDNVTIRRYMAHIYEQAGQLDLALLAWEGTYKVGGDPWVDGAEYARVALLVQRYDLARELYHHWLDLAPADSSRRVTALNNLGYSYLLERQDEQACYWLEQALAIDPLHRRAQANLHLLRRMQQIDELP